MKLEIINPLSEPEWDALLLANEKATFFHASPWARVLREAYGYEPHYFTVVEDGALTCLIPVMEVKSCLTGTRGVSLPFTDVCEPIIPGHLVQGEVWNFIREYGRSRKWKYIELRGGKGFGKNPQSSSSYFEHILDLSEGEESVYKSLRTSHKRNIKKAEKTGVEIDFTNSASALNDFCHLNCLTRKMHGLPPQPLSFFKQVLKHIIHEKNGFLVSARYNGKAIAACMFFHFGNKAIYKYGASDNKFLHLRANNLLMWKAIERYCKEGYTHFSFGRTDLHHEGLKQFKLGWGAEEKALQYFKYDFSKNQFVKSISKTEGFHNRIFSKMPVAISKTIGKILYRHVA